MPQVGVTGNKVYVVYNFQQNFEWLFYYYSSKNNFKFWSIYQQKITMTCHRNQTEETNTSQILNLSIHDEFHLLSYTMQFTSIQYSHIPYSFCICRILNLSISNRQFFKQKDFISSNHSTLGIASNVSTALLPCTGSEKHTTRTQQPDNRINVTDRVKQIKLNTIEENIVDQIIKKYKRTAGGGICQDKLISVQFQT